ncbi:MAG: DUF255 domain-containing protein [Bacteroidia bacterium]|nr:DUF255 domain-containing protein [Bacteroidia bacterium]
MKTVILSVLLLTICLFPKVTANDKVSNSIHWVSMEYAVDMASLNNRKILVDVYTNWCAWCKIMEQKTYSNEQIISYINEKYYAVRLNAESKDSIRFQGKMFGLMPQSRVNQLASLLLNGKLTYPTTVIMSKNAEVLSPVAGYMEPSAMMPILKYYAEDIYQKQSWEDYKKTSLVAESEKK